MPFAIRRFWIWCLRKFASCLQRRDIACLPTGETYLERYRIFGWMPGSRFDRWPFGIYLHRFCLPDQDRALHNHPWPWAFSIVLSGGYTERRGVGDPMAEETRTLRAPALNWISHSSFHSIDKLHGETWTLFVVGRRVTTWGFLLPGRGFVNFKERLAERRVKTQSPGLVGIAVEDSTPNDDGTHSVKVDLS